jgi:ribosomal protein S18 acetylase RimI-like enzyme
MNEASLVIRPATASDLQGIHELTVQLGYSPSIEETRQRLDSVFATSQHAVFVAELGQKIAGWIHVQIIFTLESGWSAEISGLIVDHKTRRKNAGTLLVNEAIKWGKVNRLPKLRVRTNMLREDARQFYQSIGFNEQKRQIVFQLSLEGK